MLTVRRRMAFAHQIRDEQVVAPNILGFDIIT
jgi:hypothetical protein